MKYNGWDASDFNPRWSGWGLDLMMRNIKENTIKKALYLMLGVALIMCSYFIIFSTCLSQQILAGSLLVTIIVGGFINVWKIFHSSDELDELSNKLDEIINVMGEGLTQTRDIEEQRRRDEREPPKELLKSQLNKVIMYWEDGKKSLIEGEKKRKKELKKKLFESGNEIRTKVDKNEKFLSQVIADEAKDIAKDLINFSNKITHVAVANEEVERTKRINQKLIKEGDKLIERARELIKEI